MKRTLSLLLLTFFFGLTSWAQDCHDPNQEEESFIVKTQSGYVKGFNHEGSVGFLGIPYALVERFMPPKPIGKWPGVRHCDKWGPQAMQNTNGQQLGEDKMSEKWCCVLNVWTDKLPQKDAATKKLKPVMVWLHGGAFDFGTSEWDPGMKLAQHDVVVVSVNHRLNILGFLDLSPFGEKYKYSGNVGMLDIVEALKWVQTNIREFGGDPDNVTIFGESGGGGKVGTLMCMPPAKGLFHKAIIMSGTILNVNTKQMTEELGKAVLKELNIAPEDVDRIKDVPYAELRAAGQKAMAASIGARKPGTPMMWGFGPTPDGEVLLQQPFQNGFAKISDNIPLLIGTTFNEVQPLRYGKDMTLDEARRELMRTFGFDTQAYIKAFAEAYPDYTPQDLLSIDWMFRPKTIITADEIAQTRQAPTYMYLFTKRSDVNKGCVHGAELKYCFDNIDAGSPEHPSVGLADAMSTIWARFAKDGNPNVSWLPDTWHPYTKENGELFEFGDKLQFRHNHDRKLAEIIDKHCFQQLDEFRDKQSRRQLKVGDVVMTISPRQGGKILSLKYKDQEMISQSKFPESFGSTFWTSPQKEWNWPPVPEFDKNPYTVEEKDGKLILTGEVSNRLKYRIRKEFSTDEKDGAFVVTYAIINESGEERKVAPWEITRVINDGGVIFFKAPLKGITPAGLMAFEEKYGAVWYCPDEANQNRKINADGKGWLAYANNGLLLLKKFDDLKADQPAPDEAEIQVYVNRGKSYIELESQGAYTTLQPGQEVKYTVRWYLKPFDGDATPSKQLLKMTK